MADPDLYRTKAEIEEWKQRDAISSFSSRLQKSGAISEAGICEIEATVAREIEEAVAFAEAGPLEPVADLLRDVYAPAAT